MIYDYRMYTLKPGATADYRAGVKEIGLPIRQRHGVTLAGWYWSEVGALNQVVHIWGYDDVKHMEEAKHAFHRRDSWLLTGGDRGGQAHKKALETVS